MSYFTYLHKIGIARCSLYSFNNDIAHVFHAYRCGGREILKHIILLELLEATCRIELEEVGVCIFEVQW